MIVGATKNVAGPIPTSAIVALGAAWGLVPPELGWFLDVMAEMDRQSLSPAEQQKKPKGMKRRAAARDGDDASEDESPEEPKSTGSNRARRIGSRVRR